MKSLLLVLALSQAAAAPALTNAAAGPATWALAMQQTKSLSGQHRFTEALATARRALPIARRFGPLDTRLAATYDWLGIIQRDMGACTEAPLNNSHAIDIWSPRQRATASPGPMTSQGRDRGMRSDRLRPCAISATTGPAAAPGEASGKCSRRRVAGRRTGTHGSQKCLNIAHQPDRPRQRRQFAILHLNPQYALIAAHIGAFERSHESP